MHQDVFIMVNESHYHSFREEALVTKHGGLGGIPKKVRG